MVHEDSGISCHFQLRLNTYDTNKHVSGWMLVRVDRVWGVFFLCRSYILSPLIWGVKKKKKNNKGWSCSALGPQSRARRSISPLRLLNLSRPIYTSLRRTHIRLTTAHCYVVKPPPKYHILHLSFHWFEFVNMSIFGSWCDQSLWKRGLLEEKARFWFTLLEKNSSRFHHYYY